MYCSLENTGEYSLQKKKERNKNTRKKWVLGNGLNLEAKGICMRVKSFQE